MKSCILLILCSWLFQISLAQSNYNKKSGYDPQMIQANQLKYEVYSMEFNRSKDQLVLFVKQKQFYVVNQNETKRTFTMEVKIKESQIALLDSFVQKQGYVTAKNLNSFNNSSRLEEEKLELERLEQRKKEYEKMLVKIDSVKSLKYYEHWEKIREIENQIFDIKGNINKLNAVKDVYTVLWTLRDEQSSPDDEASVNFVHMPGVEYVRLFTQNPTAGLSSQYYEGFNLKYLFTKGRSYFSLGALKAVNPKKADSLAYSEMFTLTFGQDWYSRHFGRGKHRFFNLFIGYQVGYAFGYRNSVSRGIPFTAPAVGIEIVKTRYFLWDVNGSYFLPLNNLNQGLRGFKLGTAINVSF